MRSRSRIDRAEFEDGTDADLTFDTEAPVRPEFGAEYDAYRSRTSWLIPRLY